MDLTETSTELVRDAITRELSATPYKDLIGISCIARGADSILAQAVLDYGGALEVVLPSSRHREKKVKPDHAPLFDSLVERAATVRTLPFENVDRDAYEAANATLVGSCDRLFAVWDGQPSQKSGTGTVVERARANGVPVAVVWPAGAERTPK